MTFLIKNLHMVFMLCKALGGKLYMNSWAPCLDSPCGVHIPIKLGPLKLYPTLIPTLKTILEQGMVIEKGCILIQTYSHMHAYL
jgi:hypothetical protein